MATRSDDDSEAKQLMVEIGRGEEPMGIETSRVTPRASSAASFANFASDVLRAHFT